MYTYVYTLPYVFNIYLISLVVSINVDQLSVSSHTRYEIIIMLIQVFQVIIVSPINVLKCVNFIVII